MDALSTTSWSSVFPSPEDHLEVLVSYYQREQTISPDTIEKIARSISMRVFKRVHFELLENGSDYNQNIIVRKNELRERTENQEGTIYGALSGLFNDKLNAQSIATSLVDYMTTLENSITYNDRVTSARVLFDIASTIITDIFPFERPEWVNEMYTSKGYIFDQYFGFVNPDSPYYLALIKSEGAPALTPQSFDVLNGLWSIRDGERAAETLNEISLDAWSNDNFIDTAKKLTKAVILSGSMSIQALERRSVNKRDIINAIMASVPQDQVGDVLTLKLITGKAQHANVILPGFQEEWLPKVDVETFSFNALRASRKYSLNYYRLVYRRLMDLSKYEARYFCNMDLSMKQLSNIMNANLADPPAISENTNPEDVCARIVQQVVQTDDSLTLPPIKASLIENDLLTLNSLYERALTEPDQQIPVYDDPPVPQTTVLPPPISASLVEPIPSPRQISPTQERKPADTLISFLIENGNGQVNEAYIYKAFRTVDPDLHKVYSGVMKFIYRKQIAALGYDTSQYKNYTADDLKHVRDSLYTRKAITRIITFFEGNMNDYATMSNADIINYLMQQPGFTNEMIAILPGEIPTNPTFEELGGQYAPNAVPSVQAPAYAQPSTVMTPATQAPVVQDGDRISEILRDVSAYDDNIIAKWIYLTGLMEWDGISQVHQQGGKEGLLNVVDQVYRGNLHIYDTLNSRWAQAVQP